MRRCSFSFFRIRTLNIIANNVTPRARRNSRKRGVFRGRKNGINRTGCDPVFHIAHTARLDRCGFERNAFRVTAIDCPLGVFLPTAFAGACEVQNAARNIAIEKLRKCLRDIAGVRGRGNFVGDGIDLIAFPGALDHAVDKTRPIRTENPGDTHDKMTVRLQN